MGRGLFYVLTMSNTNFSSTWDLLIGYSFSGVLSQLEMEQFLSVPYLSALLSLVPLVMMGPNCSHTVSNATLPSSFVENRWFKPYFGLQFFS